MNIEKICIACKGKFRDPPSEPFQTCHSCRKPDTVEHKQERAAEPKSFKNGPDEWEDLLEVEGDGEIDWDDIHRAYEDNQ